MAKKQEETKEETTAVATKEEAGVPAVIDYSADEGVGQEDYSADDITLPYLIIVNDGAKVLKPSRGDYIEGIQIGDIFNSATRELFKGPWLDGRGIYAVPCYHEKCWIETEPKKQGAFIRRYDDPKSATVRRAEWRTDSEGFKHLTTPDGTWLEETEYYYWMYLNPNSNTFEEAITKHAGRGLKNSQGINTAIVNFRHVHDGKKCKVGMFGQMYCLGFDTAKSNNGEKEWYVWTLVDIKEGNQWAKPADGYNNRGLLVTDAGLYQQAKNFRDLIVSGKVTASDEHDDVGSGDSDGDII